VERFLRRPAEGSALIRELRALTGQPPLFQVLIIDDEERDRYLLKQRLRNLPLMIEEASSATEGIRRVPLYKPDLIFLDLVMPDLSGFEVLKRLKNESTSSEIPVVVVTSRVLTNAEREELLSRAREIVSKEVVSRTDFAEVIRRAAGESFSNAFRA
jgi:CheY-like chemotaxis protein